MPAFARSPGATGIYVVAVWHMSMNGPETWRGEGGKDGGVLTDAFGHPTLASFEACLDEMKNVYLVGLRARGAMRLPAVATRDEKAVVWLLGR